MKELTVFKLNAQGQEVWQYPALLLERGEHHVRLEAFFNRDDLDLGFAVFARGDRFIEYFYSDRWYNIFAVHEGNTDRLRGWYCNVCRPAWLGETAVRCEDLALDLWVTADGDTHVLDEEEFADLALTARERERSLMALATLEQLAKKGRLPR